MEDSVGLTSERQGLFGQFPLPLPLICAHAIQDGIAVEKASQALNDLAMTARIIQGRFVSADATLLGVAAEFHKMLFQDELDGLILSAHHTQERERPFE